MPAENRFEFAIGIYAGPSPVHLRPLAAARNPVLSRHDVTDRDAAFVADPFMTRVDGMWYMFFEVMAHGSEAGEIGLATSTDARRWRYEGIVLSEKFHLSYPQVFAWHGAYYMVPETYQAGGAQLYKALEFPRRWQAVSMLVRAPVLLDGSLIFHGDRWWMFASGAHSNDCLRLYFSDQLEGPWREHPQSPLRSGDPHRSRPAGRIVIANGRPIRFAQDCFPEYGTSVHAFAVVELSPDRYREAILAGAPVLGPGRERWNRFGMHHVDAHQMGPDRWIACVDGR